MIINISPRPLSRLMTGDILEKLTPIVIAKAAPVEPQPITVGAIITGYSSTPDQTDDTPFITASGRRVHDGVVAANFLPFGTRIKIPELFGDQTFVVYDRMNRRYDKAFPHRIDVWRADRQSAQEVGKRRTAIIIL